eukprot:CAMPEP_0185909284 /NCGR_PEP_ID=MMETSP0196C-20130402/11966_1 /TAXON_ID=2932 /ORGANISM="Alexandrium fundyense, Strain CCMP1719" /LENGTH=38 /DNA_ID= /DNA_START= /DNA_END= /DNA_ORIENTATION=
MPRNLPKHGDVVKHSVVKRTQEQALLLCRAPALLNELL